MHLKILILAALNFFRTWSDFSIVDDVKEKFRFSDIRIRIDKTSNALLLEGPCDVVRQVKMEITKCLQVLIIELAVLKQKPVGTN